MKCRTVNCERTALELGGYCIDCLEESLAIPSRRGPINWFAIFLLVACLVAYAVLVWGGRA